MTIISVGIGLVVMFLVCVLVIHFESKTEIYRMTVEEERKYDLMEIEQDVKRYGLNLGRPSHVPGEKSCVR